MLLADTLSRAYLPEVNATEFSRELEDIDHRVWLPVTGDRWQQLKNAAADTYLRIAPHQCQVEPLACGSPSVQRSLLGGLKTLSPSRKNVLFETSYPSPFSLNFVLFENREDVTSCVTCYVVPIVDSANEIFVRVFVQPCALGFQCLGSVASDQGIGVLLILNKSS